MCVDGSEKRGANAVEAILFVGDVVVCTAIAKFFGESKVDHVDHFGSTASAHDKICGLNIAVDERVRMYKLDAGYL